jgi:hypothetical protein
LIKKQGYYTQMWQMQAVGFLADED